MVYALLTLTKTTHHLTNLVGYISVRSIMAFLVSLLISLFFGQWFIKKSKQRFRVKVSDRPPARHQKKNNTPSMGGLFILGIILLSSLLFNNLADPKVYLMLAALLGFGGIGTLDDLSKIRSTSGITARKKILLQILVAGCVMTAWYCIDQPNTALCVPFFKQFNPELGLFIIPWGMFIMIGVSNAVNLTDGLDGLATGPLIVNFTTFSVIAYLAGNSYFAQYLHIPATQTGELTIIGASLIGALIGFLWYNAYPAQIFMGDVGSLSLGAGLALMAIFCRQELLLPLAGGIFVVETLSVIIQVASYKLIGRRVFRMAPIHHHFELLGWNEAKITIRFWIISLILSVIALLTLKIR